MNKPSFTNQLPRLTLQETREKSLKRLHPWIFSKAVKSVSGKPTNGQTIEVVSSHGEWLGYAAYSADSQIRARVWSFDKELMVDEAFFLKRIERAWALRTSLYDLNQTNGLRVVAAESDGLPGVTIDKYDTILVCQLLSAGADVWRDAIVQALIALFPEHSIYERSDVDVRKKEGLKPVTGWLHLPRDNGEVVIKEHGMSLLVDVMQGHKTGFYLDQPQFASFHYRNDPLAQATAAPDLSQLQQWSAWQFSFDRLRGNAISGKLLLLSFNDGTVKGAIEFSGRKAVMLNDLVLNANTLTFTVDSWIGPLNAHARLWVSI